MARRDVWAQLGGHLSRRASMTSTERKLDLLARSLELLLQRSAARTAGGELSRPPVIDEGYDEDGPYGGLEHSESEEEEFFNESQ